MAKKELKKKNIRLRRRVRRTAGVACLITALLVAAIPVPEASAAGVDEKYTWDDKIGVANTEIPVVPANCNTIYTNEDGTYQFAWVKPSATSTDTIAVILGYSGGTLDEDSQGRNELVIPDTVDAYTRYSENEGSRSGYVAVSRSQQPLFYQATPDIYEEVQVPTGVSDNEGNPTYTTEQQLVTPATYLPCYTTDNAWKNLALDQFYYKSGNNYIRTESSDNQWIKNITVAYIGNQTLQSKNTSAVLDGAIQEWEIAETNGSINTDPGKGIFAGESNIQALTVGENLLGIGNYAFYNCSGLQSITLGNGLQEIGKYAFANCANMSEINMDSASRIPYISDYTFQNCRALTSFTLPTSVTTIYDHAFDGCSRLSSVDLTGETADANVILADMGYAVFRNCAALTELALPDSMSNTTVNLGNFEGCSSLGHITVESPYTKFEAHGDDGYSGPEYSSADFLEDVSAAFYFEGAGTSAIHDYTKEHAIAFKYADQDLYEIIVREKNPDGGMEDLTYRVDSHNQLQYFDMTGSVEEVTIPAQIGPYGISAIDSRSFSNNCFLEKITIPATVTAINDGAFKGCHNLEHVIFANAGNITHIGEDAFATQEVEGVHDTECDGKLDQNPSLTFTGTVGADIVPFAYAMNQGNYINSGTQNRTYITYYSGWPTNLEIRYVEDPVTGTGTATLVDYPTFTELTDGTKYKEENYPYITDEYEKAVGDAVNNYNHGNPTSAFTDYQRQIINAALNVSVPSGVKAIDTGLFSSVTGVLQEDGTYSVETVDGQSADTTIQSVTLADVTEIEPYTFSGCTSLSNITITGGAETIDDYAFASAYTGSDETGSDSALTSFIMTGGGGSIGDYAFCNNAKLNSVTISQNVSSMGLRPFKDCPLLENVGFSGSPYFTAESAIIYGLSDGVKDSVVQCLESRGRLNTRGTISASELSGISSIAEEAFMDCEDIGSVDLSTSNVAGIPESAFENTKSLYSASLPTTCRSIGERAFWNSNVRYVDIPSSVTYIAPSSFSTYENPSEDGYNMIEFYCEPGSAAETYADMYTSINATDKPLSTTFTVIFWDYDNRILDSQEVLIYGDAVAPEDPVREGYTFTGWLPADFTNVSRNMDIVAQYEKIDSEESKYTVTFIDYDDTVLYTQRVAYGEDAITPQDPAREGYTFTGWRPAITNITKDTDTYAQYERIDSGASVTTPAPGATATPAPGATATPAPGTTATPAPGTTASPSPSPGAALYTLTVRNGSGSGSYAAGATVIVVADNPSSTQEFSVWTTDNDNIKFASNAVTATTLVMPAENATVTANYVEKSTGSGSGSSGNSSSGNSGSGSSSDSSGNATGTVVVIDKNGLSNTGVVSVTINGSSDNFMVRITEDSAASEAAVKALLDEYGSLDNIKYFPMDISLYDSTGNTKITDTSGLSISITLPLPDSLITYAGNNKVAGVVDDKLDKLAARFTTIDGVSCITFTAEHFSPYVIYVDTQNLTSTTVIDDSPRTGDIHPKWFVVTGLTCVALVLFMKKDRAGRAAVAR